MSGALERGQFLTVWFCQSPVIQASRFVRYEGLGNDTERRQRNMGSTIPWAQEGDLMGPAGFTATPVAWRPLATVNAGEVSSLELQRRCQACMSFGPPVFWLLHF